MNWEWYYCIRRFFYNNLTPRRLKNNLKYGIQNLIVWFPIIWKDRDWDNYFLYAVMHKKLQKMSRFHAKYGITMGAPKYAKQTKICYLLLKRLMEENYTTPYDKRNKPHFDWFSKKMKESFTKESDENGMICIVSHDESDEPDARWIIPASKHEAEMIQQDIDLFCKIFSRHVQEWWD